MLLTETSERVSSIRLQPLPLGEWSGPVQSSFGFHLVRLDDRWDAVLPPFGAIRDRVSWRIGARNKFKARRQRFSLTIFGPPTRCRILTERRCISAG